MVIDALLAAIEAGVVSSAHDCSDGGLAIALAECCIANLDSERGVEIDLSRYSSLTDRGILFGETQARIIVSSPAPDKVIAIAEASGVPCAQIGRVRQSSDSLNITLPKGSLRSSLSSLRRAYHSTIPSIMARTVEHANFDELAPVAAH